MSAIKIFERFYHKKCYKALFSGPAVEYNRQCLEQERSNFNMETSNSLLDADIIREQKPVWAFSRKVFCEGIRDGVPIALGYFAVSFSLGIAARKAGFTPFQGFLASLLNNASAGEYAAFALIMSGASYFQVAVITLIANARYLLMSCALAQRFAPGTPFWHRLVIGYDVTDELFGITIARPGSLNPCYTYGAILLAAPAWASGTALGIVAGNLLPLRAVSALSVALYGMFLAIIIPPARKDKVVAVLVAISFALSFACNYLPGILALSDGTRTILLTVLISSVAAVLFPVKDQEAEHDA
jgi:predicted branched-subunit amino acid permease